MTEQISRLRLFPLTAEVGDEGHLVIGGCDTLELAAEFGTPLYLFDELSLRSRCAEFKKEFGQRYAETTILYAAKAFINKTLLRIFREEGFGLDVVSGGEIGLARAAGFPLERVCFCGNNKSVEEIDLALECGVGRIVVDNFYELEMLDRIAGERNITVAILLRLSPGVDSHTHRYINTGNIDSKFGFPLAVGEDAVTAAMSLPNLSLVGIHFHLGSLIFEVEPYREAIDHILDFAAGMKRKHGFELEELDVGGGFAVPYTLSDPSRPISAYAEVITSSIKKGCRKLGLELPRLVIEPGRSMVAQAGVALYTVGAIKDIPGVRCYVAIDGGMGDNIRPALYEGKHVAIVANKMTEEETTEVTIAGKFCESGDILIRDIKLPALAAGDTLAVAGCGAYCLTQASNYNAFFKPAVVMVGEGRARLMRRRETIEDLTRCDVG